MNRNGASQSSHSPQRAGRGSVSRISNYSRRSGLRLRGEPRQGLSGRDWQYLKCLARGLTEKEIAVQLGIQKHTVQNRMVELKRKMQVRSIGQAIYVACVQMGLRLLGDERRL